MQYNNINNINNIFLKRLMREKEYHKRKMGCRRKIKVRTFKKRCSRQPKVEYEFQDAVISLSACKSYRPIDILFCSNIEECKGSMMHLYVLFPVIK